MTDFNELLDEQLEKEEFRKEYGAFGAESAIMQYRHKTLEERAVEYGGELSLDGEFDYGDPARREIW